MSTTISPLAPKSIPDMPPVAGVRLATAAAGIKYLDRTDVLLALLDAGTTTAGVFTQSKCPSAPVEWCRANLKGAKPRALVVNSGNANAFTGKSGRQACKLTAQIAARAIGCKPAGGSQRPIPRLFLRRGCGIERRTRRRRLVETLDISAAAQLLDERGLRPVNDVVVDLGLDLIE